MTQRNINLTLPRSWNECSYYGEGIRYALVARSEIGSHLLLIAKLGTTDYFDRRQVLGLHLFQRFYIDAECRVLVGCNMSNTQLFAYIAG